VAVDDDEKETIPLDGDGSTPSKKGPLEEQEAKEKHGAEGLFTWDKT
jgi:hypothetical protein